MRRRWRKLLRWTLGLGSFVLLAGFGAGAYWYDCPRVAADLPAAALAYRDAGLPWTAKDLNPDPPVKPEENAAPLLREAIAAWPQHREDWGVSYDNPLRSALLYGEPTDPILKGLAPALALAHQAASRPKMDFEYDWALGPNLQMREHGPTKSIIRAFAERAKLQAAQGEDDAALADLEDGHRLARLIVQTPTIIAMLVSATGESLVFASVQACLAEAAPNPGRLRRYRDWLARSAPSFDLRNALRGEALMFVAGSRNFDRMGIGRGLLPPSDWEPFYDTVEDMHGDHSAHDIKEIRREGLPENMRSRAYMARGLRTWTDFAERTEDFTVPPGRIAQEMIAVDAQMWGELPMASHTMDAMLFPVYTQACQVGRSPSARWAMTLAFADALILHAETGKWPTLLAVLDPLGSGTLRMRTDRGRFRIWSVGTNGKDENGLDGVERDEKHRSDDLVAAYPPIPRRHSQRPPPSIGPPPGFSPD